MPIKKKKFRRSDTKILTKEGRLLAYLRESRNLSMRKTADMIKVSCSMISHAENGRMDVSHTLILKLLNVYGYSYEEFKGMLDGDFKIPEHTRSECIEIIKRLDEQKLKTVKSFLMTFLGQ